MNYRFVTHYIYGATHYDSIVTMSNHTFSTTMQPHYNYSHDVMLTLIIFIPPLKLDMWHYEDFWI